MAKYLLRIQARELRAQGNSVKSIAKQLHVSKGSASIWVRDLVLSVEQLEKIRHSTITGSEAGRLKGAFMQKHRRLQLIDQYEKEGRAVISGLTDRELLVAGLALYWGEGSKKKRSLEFCNSDPKMVKFLLLWLKRCFNIETDRLSLRVGINQIHTSRDKIVRRFWSEVTNVPLKQFRRTTFTKTISKKVYSNHNEHYGTLRIVVTKPGSLFYKVIGLINGLAWQGSSAS